MELIKRAIERAKAEANVSSLREGPERIAAARPNLLPQLFDAGTSELKLQRTTLEANRIVAWNKQDARTSAFDILRTKVLTLMKLKGWRTVAVTSPTDSCGKTTVAINLAFSIAQQTSPDVVLTDLDLRKPRVATYLGFQPKADLLAYLDGQAPLNTYMVDAEGTRLRVIPNAGVCSTATEHLVRPQIDSIFSAFAAESGERVGLFDLTPLLVTDDALAVLPRMDCVLLVLGEGVSRKDEVKEALNLLSDTNLLGVVLNKSRWADMTHYHHYHDEG